MPKQRVRRIVVDGALYRWRVRMADPHWISVRVWREGERVPLADAEDRTIARVPITVSGR